MRAFTFLFGLTLLLLIKLPAAAGEAAKVPTDEEATRLLVGGWILKVEPKEKMLGFGTIIFALDGRFTAELGINGAGKLNKVTIKGTWKVEKSVIVQEVTSSSVPQLLPAGVIGKDTILELNERALVSRDEEGEIDHWAKDPG